jgi:hypothetical protein
MINSTLEGALALFLLKSKAMETNIVNPYPNEPHPDGEWLWKSWWIAKFFDPQAPLYRDDLEWVHRCWRETKARFPQSNQ